MTETYLKRRKYEEKSGDLGYRFPILTLLDKKERLSSRRGAIALSFLDLVMYLN